MQLNEWFNSGMSLERYTEELTKHRENFNHIYENFTFPNDEDFFQKLEAAHLSVLAIAEPWCGHCMMDVPILKRLVEHAHMGDSVCLRDTHPELMDKYETDGKRVIPIFIFIDQNGQEVAQWGPRAPEVTEVQQEILNQLPDKGTPQYDEALQEKRQELSKRFSTDQELWRYVYNDIKKVLLPIVQ